RPLPPRRAPVPGPPRRRVPLRRSGRVDLAPPRTPRSRRGRDLRRGRRAPPLREVGCRTAVRLLDRIRRPGPWLAVAVLLAAPALLLSPCLFGDRTYLPFDLAEFPPARLMLDEAERAAIAATPANHDVTEIPVLVVPELE